MRQSTIYALRHPITGVIFYVGRTGSPTKRRLTHEECWQYFLGRTKHRLNRKPDFVILETCLAQDGPRKEAEWIERFRGPDLMNGKVYLQYVRIPVKPGPKPKNLRARELPD